MQKILKRWPGVAVLTVGVFALTASVELFMGRLPLGPDNQTTPQIVNTALFIDRILAEP